MQAQFPIVIQQPATPMVVVNNAERRGGCCSCGFRCLGVAEVLLGILVLILGIVAIALPKVSLAFLYWISDTPSFIREPLFPDTVNAGQGIWCGILLIVSGSLGISIQGDSSKGLYVANLVFATLAALASITTMVMSALAAATIADFNTDVMAVHVIIILLAFITTIITIVHSCVGCCSQCSGNNQTQQVTYVQPQSGHLANQPVAMIGTGQATQQQTSTYQETKERPPNYAECT